MNEEKKYTKLSALVDDTFTVEASLGYKFKKWDTTENKMLSSDSWQEGYQKKYTVETDKGVLDLGTGQMGSLLEAVFVNGEAHLIGTTYEVKSNGKTGMEIRYFFNVKKTTTIDQAGDGSAYEQAKANWGKPEVTGDITDEGEINLDDIPF